MNPFGDQLLNVIAYIPLVGAVVLLAMPANRPRAIAQAATVIAGLDLLASLPLWFGWRWAATSKEP